MKEILFQVGSVAETLREPSPLFRQALSNTENALNPENKPSYDALAPFLFENRIASERLVNDQNLRGQDIKRFVDVPSVGFGGALTKEHLSLNHNLIERKIYRRA